METKVCKKCGEARPLDEYYTLPPKPSGKVYRVGACSACRIAQDRQWRAARPRVEAPTAKVCRDCGAEQPISAYRRCATNRDGFRDACKACWAGRPSRSPVYRQEERRRAKARRGRVYMTREERRTLRAQRATVKRAKRAAQQHPLRIMRSLLVALLRARCQAEGLNVDSVEYRAKWNTSPEFRERERARQAHYKHANPDKAAAWGDLRKRRAAAQSDGTLTRGAVGRLYATADRCPYCHVQMAAPGRTKGPRDKTLDHLEPVSRGGAHSLANVTICCRACNLRKNRRPFAVWLAMLDEPHRVRAARMYERVTGGSPAQVALPLFARSA